MDDEASPTTQVEGTDSEDVSKKRLSRSGSWKAYFFTAALLAQLLRSQGLEGGQEVHGKDRSWELYIFKAVLWLVVICAFVAIAFKARSFSPSTVPFHYLLITATVASALVLALPTLLSRISEVSFAGVKVTLAQQEVSLKEIEITEILPEAFSDQEVKIHNISVPFTVKELEGAQLYAYERASFALYGIFDQIDDPNKLDLKNREKYRNLIFHVGKAAYAMKHYTKYLKVVLTFLSFTDRRLNFLEEFTIGHAYLCAADEQSGINRREYLKSALPYLSAAMEKDPEDAKVPFNLGLCLFYLDGYRRGIELMETCINLYEPMSPWAKWNVAFALKKLQEYSKSIGKLEEIPPGPWWEAIKADDWSGQPTNTDFQNQFNELCARKLGA